MSAVPVGILFKHPLQLKHLTPVSRRDVVDDLARRCLRLLDQQRQALALSRSVSEARRRCCRAGLMPELFDGIALVACGTPYWRAWPAAALRSIRGGIVMIDWVSRLLPWHPGRLLGFGATSRAS